MSSAAPFHALCGPPWTSSSSGSGPSRSGRGSASLHHGAVGDGELALDSRRTARRRRGPRRARCARSRRRSRGRRATISPNEVGVAEHDRGAVAGDREACDDAPGAVEHRRGRRCRPADRLQVGAAAVAQAEQDPAVGGLAAEVRRGRPARRPSRCGPGDRRGRSGSPPSSGTANRRAWPTGSPGQPTTSSASPSAAYDDGAGDAVGEGHDTGPRLRRRRRRAGGPRAEASGRRPAPTGG